MSLLLRTTVSKHVLFVSLLDLIYDVIALSV